MSNLAIQRSAPVGPTGMLPPGMDEDYALVKAPGPRPPGFVLRARAGIWSLYEATRR